MYKIGDRVFYPLHGAGIIETIEEREILGEKHKYYIFRIVVGDIKIMIPIDNIDNLGIRGVISEYELEEVLEVLSDDPTNMEKKWSRRYRENENKIKGGNMLEIAEVVRNLTSLDRLKKLSPGESKILQSAKAILMSEIMLIKGIKVEEAEKVIEQSIK